MSLAKRILSIIITLFLVSLLVFFLSYFSLGDERSLLGDEIKAENNTKGNFLHSYFSFLGDFFTMKWGEDIRGLDYRTTILERLRITLVLTGLTLIITVPLSLFWGSVAALNKGKKSELALNIVSSVLLSSPSFLISISLILVFSVLLKWFPPSGFVRSAVSFSQFLKSLFLPTLALSLLSLPSMLRLTKREIGDNLNKSFTLLYIAEGAKGADLVLHSALKPSLPFLFTLYSGCIATCLSGSVVVERIFNIPGVGALLTSAALNRDFRLSSILSMLIALLVSFSFIVSEILSYIVDPRLRRAK